MKTETNEKVPTNIYIKSLLGKNTHKCVDTYTIENPPCLFLEVYTVH